MARRRLRVPPPPAPRPARPPAAGAGHRASLWLGATAAILTIPSAPVAHAQLAPYVIEGDAIAASLTGAKGDAARGRTIVASHTVGLCLLCHSGPFPEDRFQGNIAPSLVGAGSRWTEGQLRLRIVDASKLNPETIMPPYYRIDGLTRVAPSYRGQPVLSAEQIEDVVAFLTTLRDE